MSSMEEGLKEINKLIQTENIIVDDESLTVDKIDAEYDPNFYVRVRDTIKLSEKLDKVLSVKGVHFYEFTEEEAQLYFMMTHGTIIDLFEFYDVSPNEVKDCVDWEDYIYRILGTIYIYGDSLYVNDIKVFTKEVIVILNLNRADLLSENDKGKEAKNQRDFNQFIKEIKKTIKNEWNLGIRPVLNSCKIKISSHQKKYSLKEDINFIERYVVLKGFKIFKTFSRYHDVYERHRDIPLQELLSLDSYLSYFKSKDYLKKQLFFRLLVEDLKKYEPYIREEIKKSKSKEKPLSDKIKSTYVNYYSYSLLAMYYARNVEGSYATAKAILWQEIKYDGENEDILREGIEQAKEIIDNETEIDWNPSNISKMCGITEGRAKKYKLHFLFGTVYKSNKSRVTDWRHKNGGKTREEYVKSVQPPQDKITYVAELKKQGKTIPQIADIMGVSTKTVSNYWKRYRDKVVND